METKYTELDVKIAFTILKNLAEKVKIATSAAVPSREMPWRFDVIIESIFTEDDATACGVKFTGKLLTGPLIDPILTTTDEIKNIKLLTATLYTQGNDVELVTFNMYARDSEFIINKNMPDEKLSLMPKGIFNNKKHTSFLWEDAIAKFNTFVIYSINQNINFEFADKK
jgi:hypothetical protein